MIRRLWLVRGPDGGILVAVFPSARWWLCSALRLAGLMVPEDPEPDLGACPYYARYRELPGHDPSAVCGSGCREEPACVTDEPAGGWPSRRDRQEAP